MGIRCLGFTRKQACAKGKVFKAIFACKFVRILVLPLVLRLDVVWV